MKRMCSECMEKPARPHSHFCTMGCAQDYAERAVNYSGTAWCPAAEKYVQTMGRNLFCPECGSQLEYPTKRNR